MNSFKLSCVLKSVAHANTCTRSLVKLINHVGAPWLRKQLQSGVPVVCTGFYNIGSAKVTLHDLLPLYERTSTGKCYAALTPGPDPYRPLASRGCSCFLAG